MYGQFQDGRARNRNNRAHPPVVTRYARPDLAPNYPPPPSATYRPESVTAARHYRAPYMPHLHQYGPSPATPIPAAHSPYSQQPSFYGHPQPSTVGPRPYEPWNSQGYNSPPSHGQPQSYDPRSFQTPVPPYHPTFNLPPGPGHGFASSGGQHLQRVPRHGNPHPGSSYPGQYGRRPSQHSQDLVRPPLAHGMKTQVKRHSPTWSMRSNPPPSKDAVGPGSVANHQPSAVEGPDDGETLISDPFPDVETPSPAERVARAISTDPTGWETFDTLLSVPSEKWDCPSQYIRSGNLAETSKNVRETARWPAIQDDPAFRDTDFSGPMIPMAGLRRALRQKRAQPAVDASEVGSTRRNEAVSPIEPDRQGKDSSQPPQDRTVSAARVEENISSKVDRPRTNLRPHESPMEIDGANRTQKSPDSYASGANSIPVSRRGSMGYESSRPSPNKSGQRSRSPSLHGRYLSSLTKHCYR